MPTETLASEIGRLMREAIDDVEIQKRVGELPRIEVTCTYIEDRLLMDIVQSLRTTPTNSDTVLPRIRFITDADPRQRPDLACEESGRRQATKAKPLPNRANWDPIPSLVIETLSRTDTYTALDDRLDEYFRFGVELVWIVHPWSRQVYVYQAVNRGSLLTVADTLTGGSVLPGFSIPIASLFVERQTSR